MTRNDLKVSVTEAIPMQKPNHLFLSAAAAVLLLLTAAPASAQSITVNPQSLAFFAQVAGNPPAQHGLGFHHRRRELDIRQPDHANLAVHADGVRIDDRIAGGQL
jgi:hypothetical protein